MNNLVPKTEMQVSESPNPFKGFSIDAMQQFYAAKRFLCCLDGTELVDQCVLSDEEEKNFDGTYELVNRTYYAEGFLGEMIEGNHVFVPNYTTSRKVFISTSLLMDKLDVSLYFWRELNPELVRLLSKNKSVEREVIVNWVKLIHYMEPVLKESTF